MAFSFIQHMVIYYPNFYLLTQINEKIVGEDQLKINTELSEKSLKEPKNRWVIILYS